MVGIKKLWYKLGVDDVLNFFVVDKDKGLDNQEVAKREQRFGYNSAQIFVPSTLSFYYYSVIRGGKLKKVHPNKLVLGDIINLSKGDIVPANLRLIKVDKLSVDEEKLSGNSAPTYKNTIACKKICTKDYQRNMLFAGSVILAGNAVAVVVDYGSASSIHTKNIKTPKLLSENNYVACEKNINKKLHKIDAVLFNNLRQEYEVIKTVQEVFFKKNITCIYLLKEDLINKVSQQLPEARIIDNKQKFTNIAKEVVLVNSGNFVNGTALMAMLKSQGFSVLYVQRGEDFDSTGLAADINLVINKNSSQTSIYKASLITDSINPKNLSSILYNKK